MICSIFGRVRRLVFESWSSLLYITYSGMAYPFLLHVQVAGGNFAVVNCTKVEVSESTYPVDQVLYPYTHKGFFDVPCGLYQWHRIFPIHHDADCTALLKARLHLHSVSSLMDSSCVNSILCGSLSSIGTLS